MSYRTETTEAAPANTLTIEIKLAPETMAALSELLKLAVRVVSPSMEEADLTPAAPAFPETGPSEIGKRVRQARIYRGLNQLQLASSTGCSDTVIGKIESGVSKPQLSIIKAMVAALGCSESWLITGQGEPCLEKRG